MILDEYIAAQEEAEFEYDPAEIVVIDDIMNEVAAGEALSSGEDDLDDKLFMQVDSANTGKPIKEGSIDYFIQSKQMEE